MTDVVTQAPTTTETPLPLPRYQCHKVVEALKIEHIAYDGPGGGATIHPADTRYPPFKVTVEYVAKHGPRAGGYWVRYEDLYQSFSPAKAFEDGNTLIPMDAAPAQVQGATQQSMLYEGHPAPPQGPAAQNLYPAQPEGETTVSDPDTHA